MLHSRLVLPLLASLLLTACQGPSLVTSLDGLSADTDQEGAFRVDQNRIVSLMGNAPGNLPGEATRFKNERAISTTFGLTAGKTYVDVLTIPPPSGKLPAQVVIDVRDKILAAQRAAALLVTARLRTACLR